MAQFNSRRYSPGRAMDFDLIVRARRLRHDLARTYLREARGALGAGDAFVRERTGLSAAEYARKMLGEARRVRVPTDATL